MSTTLTHPQDKPIGTILTSGYKHAKKVTQAWLDKRMRRHRKVTTRIIQRMIDAKAKEASSGSIDARMQMRYEDMACPDAPKDVGSLVAAKMIKGYEKTNEEAMSSKKVSKKAPKKKTMDL